MKKALSIVVAMLMVCCLGVSVFADFDLTSEIAAGINSNLEVSIPEGVDVSNGATFTLSVKGTSENDTIRVYLTQPGDTSRVTEVYYIEVVDGAFETTLDMPIDSTGAIQGTSDPTIIMFKGVDYATPLANTTFESFVIVSDAAPAETSEPETTAEPETTSEPETSAPAETGIALALVPMAIAAAAVVVSKRR